MKSSAKNIQMTSYEELLSGGPPLEAGGKGNVQEIPLSELFPFKGHPFKVLDDETMQDTVESIKAYGVLVPAFRGVHYRIFHFCLHFFFFSPPIIIPLGGIDPS